MIIGKFYIDPEDSGFTLMQVIAVDSLVPTDVIVKPVHYDRTWQRSAAQIQSLLEQVIEVKGARKYFGGGDGRAINKHSVRDYYCNGKRYQLDRNLSVAPPYYKLLAMPDEPGICPTIKIDGREGWGDDLSWKRAEAIALPAIRVHAFDEAIAST